MNHFRIAKYRFHLKAGAQGLDLAPFKSSALRGVMGRLLRQMSCAAPEQECPRCHLNRQCPYAYIFETQPGDLAPMMKGYAQIPRPYVIDPALNQPEHILEGGELVFDLLLFGQAIPLFPYFLAAFQAGGSTGLGAGKKPYRLTWVENINDCTGYRKIIYREGSELAQTHSNFWTGQDILLNTARHKTLGKITVNFLTPTQLTANKTPITSIAWLSFPLLMRNIFRRYSSLYVHHHQYIPEENYASLLDLARQIDSLVITNKTEVWERYSMRWDRHNTMTGFTGQISYKGKLAPFLPYLFLGQWLHVGKWTTFGMGRYRLELEE